MAKSEKTDPAVLKLIGEELSPEKVLALAEGAFGSVASGKESESTGSDLGVKAGVRPREWNVRRKK